MNFCSICALPIWNGANSEIEKLGNTSFHKFCLAKIREQARMQNKIVKYIWHGHRCTEVKVAEREYHFA